MKRGDVGAKRIRIYAAGGSDIKDLRVLRVDYQRRNVICWRQPCTHVAPGDPAIRTLFHAVIYGGIHIVGQNRSHRDEIHVTWVAVYELPCGPAIDSCVNTLCRDSPENLGILGIDSQ